MTVFSEMATQAMLAVEGISGIPITYRRGGNLVCALPDEALWPDRLAIPGRNLAEALDGEQMRSTSTGQEMLVPRDFPDFGDGWREPERGDEIELTDALGTLQLYVLAPPAGGHVWRFSDQLQTRIRLYLQYVEPVE